MRHIRLKKKPLEVDWARRFVDDDAYDELLEESTFVERPDGSPLLCMIKGGIDAAATRAAWSVLKGYHASTDNRGTATGIASYENRGQLRVPKGWEVESGIMGYMERSTRFPYCRETAWSAKNPAQLERMRPMVQRVDQLFAEHVPSRYAAQRAYADRTPADWRLFDTAFTTLTVNKNFRTACHKDAGDLEAGFSCLSVIRNGRYAGGNLVLPAWRIAANLGTGDLLLFDAHEYHGNTKILPLAKNVERCSIVYYYREMMAHCLPKAEELARVKNRRPGDKLFP